MKKILLSLSLVLGLMACGDKKEVTKTDMGKLVFYAGLQEDHAALVAEEFERETGIKTEFIRLGSGETIERLEAEKDNMVASVWYGGPVDGMIAAGEKGLIEEYNSPEGENIREEYKSETGVWTGIYTGYLGFVGNEKRMAEKNIEMPTSWNDLLKPEYKGEIIMPHPATSGTAYTMLATLVQLIGEDQAMEYFKKLDGQIMKYTRSGITPGKIVGLGDSAIAISFLHDCIKYKKNGYNSIVLGVPLEGTGFEIGGVVLLKGAPDKENAKKFIDWVLKSKTQELGKSVDSFQFLTNKDAVDPEEARVIAGAKLINYDFEWAGKNKKRLVERFIREIGVEIPN